MEQRQVSRLTNSLPIPRQHDLLKRLEHEEALARFMGRKVNTHLLELVRERLRKGLRTGTP